MAADHPSPVRASHAHVEVFDGLRGLAIAIVLWYHLWLVTGIPTTLIAQTGFMGVDLFFFVSGFCLFYPYARHVCEGRPMPTLAEFAQRRVEKILPSYLLALGVFAFAHASWFGTSAELGWNIAAHALFIHPFWWNTFGSISGPFWTLGIEVQFYALFPLIVGQFCRRPVLVFAAMTAVAHAYRALAGDLGIASSLWGADQLPAVLDVFGAGMLAAYAIGVLGSRQHIAHATRWWWTAGAAAAIALSVTLLSGLRDAAVSGGAPGQYVWLNAHRFAFAAAFFGGAVCLSAGQPALRAALANPVLLFAASISYNLYLWHLEIIVWLNGLGLPPALVAACAILLAWTVTVAVERPLLKGGWRRFVPGRLRLRAGSQTAAA